MVTKTTGRNGGNRTTTKPSEIHTLSNNSAVLGWFDLAANIKQSRISRQQKRTWKRKDSGKISLELTCVLMLLAIVSLMLGGVV